MYIFGNPLIAATMHIHDIRVAGRVPLQVLIYEADNGEARLSWMTSNRRTQGPGL